MPISSVFFAVLHLEDGPKIVYQVPEGLITTPPRPPPGSPTPSDLSTNVPSPPNNTNNTPPSTVYPTRPPLNTSTSKAHAPSTTTQSQYQSLSLSTTNTAAGGGGGSGGSSGPAPLFEFELISQFAIPQAELCGRLMICTTRKHRIVGFPVILKGEHYERGMFQYNLCFVFQRDLDVSPYEPVVRKVARVLTVCEVSSSGFPGGGCSIMVVMCAKILLLTIIFGILGTERAPVSFRSSHFYGNIPNTRATFCRSQFLLGDINQTR